uniref:NADH-ubiquinone oxidoreductase chain 4L n=1 Tax=Paratrioza sinica TaxID=1511640 RepID=A0A068EUD6_9HEMI|nr:NADH dehydrogenase subunit 4L [Paratrioza sinica]AID54946.1 NADH dehydrogenase subunit 4L [Paratrioza sinica]
MVSLTCLFMFYFGLILFFGFSKHILMMLLSLEFISLVMLMMIINFLSMFLYDTSIIIYVMIVMVCEAVLGLVLITLMVHTHGSDYSKVIAVLMC